MSQQPSLPAGYLLTTTYLVNSFQLNSSNKNNMHTLESVHILLQSQIIKKSWLKKFERVQSSTFFCAPSGIPILASQLAIANKQCEMWQEQFFNQSPEQHRQNSIYSFHIFQKMSFLFSFYAQFNIIVFFCDPRIRVMRRSCTVGVAVTFFRFSYLLIALGNLQSC